MSIREGGRYQAVIQGYASDGAGVARVEGMAVFVAGALRGERVELVVEHVGHSAAWARVARLVTPSPARQSPDCPHYGRCGGCQFRHMRYDEELEAKRLRVEDALARLGGVPLPVEVIHPAPGTRRYRNKVQFPIAPGSIGYFQARSHQVVDIPDCLLQPQVDSACRAAVRAWMDRFRVPAYQERSGAGLLRHLYLRTNQAGQVLCCLVAADDRLPHQRELIDALRQAAPNLVGVVLNVNPRRTNVILGKTYRTLWGQDWLEETLCGCRFRLSVPSFFQVNHAQTQRLYQRVLDLAALTGGETVVDLYCGIGTISLALAGHARQVIGVEIVPQAVADAQENARRNGLEGKARFVCGDAAALAAQLEADGVRPDVAVVDPPRKGLAAEVIGSIARMAPQRVVYVSCDPATLARDVARFRPLGYQAVQAEALDLFPRTAHVETVVLLSKGEIDSKKVRVEFSLEDMDMSGFQNYATYSQIKERVLQQTGLKVSSLYIAQIKQKHGIIERENYNKPKSENTRQPKCPLEKEAAITEALKYFGMI